VACTICAAVNTGPPRCREPDAVTVALAGASYSFISDRSTKVTYQDMTILARKDQFYIMRAPVDIAERGRIGKLGTWVPLANYDPLPASIPDASVDATALGETTTKIIQKYGPPIPQAIVPGSGPRPRRRRHRARAPSVRPRSGARPPAPACPTSGPRSHPPPHSPPLPPTDAVRRRNRGRVPAGHPYEVTMPDRSNPAAATPTLRTDAAPHAPRGA
jgi:hypothetical protein